MDNEEIDSSLEEELSEQMKEDITIEVEVSDQPRGRGRPPIPAKWVQVMSIDHDHPPKMVVQDISAGILLAAAEERVPNARRDREWEPLFCPRKFCADQQDMQFE